MWIKQQFNASTAQNGEDVYEIWGIHGKRINHSVVYIFFIWEA